MGAVFFGDAMFGGANTNHQSEYAVNQSETNHPISSDSETNNATESMAQEFSWDEDEPADEDRDSLDSVAKERESFVSTSSNEDAPGEVFSTPSEVSSMDLSDVSAGASSKTKDSLSGMQDKLSSTEDIKSVSNQVNNDLDSFFNMPKKSDASSDVVEQSTLSKPTKTEFVSNLDRTDTVGRSKNSTVEDFSTEVANAALKKEDLSIDAFEFGNSSEHNKVIDNDFVGATSSGETEPKESKATEMQSIISEDSSNDPKPSMLLTKDDENDVISGALEPVEKQVRKFKITNPKETTLPVTMSVNGEQITLKPDQTYVVNDHDGSVDVTFSRGGSFGFENKTIKNGHYRFSVTREAGWKLSN